MNTQNIQRHSNQHKMPAKRCTQDISLTADTRDNSSSKVSKYNRDVVPFDENLMTFQMPQGLDRPPREDAHTNPETYGLCEHDAPEDWPDKIKLPPAPKILTVALPEEEDDGGFFYSSGSESDLGGGSIDTLVDDPEGLLFGCLDDIFPQLFVIEKLRSGDID